MRSITVLPNLLTLGNAFCGLLAVAKGIDALALSGANPALFYVKLETACWLIFLGMVFDALDGKVARITGGASQFGAELDSFSDALTFGAAPALLAKVLLEHEGGFGHPRLHFIAAAAFALMAILRLARFNLETEPDESAHASFKGLPSPAAAGAVASTMLFYLMMRWPQLEVDDGTPTPIGRALSLFKEWSPSIPPWFLPALALMLPLLGFLMVSRVPYAHFTSMLTRKGSFFALVYVVFGAFLFFAAPIPMLFIAFNGFVIFGVVRWLVRGRREPREAPRERAAGALRD
ncbi:MAG TPA: CDP-alcohol phosphatidyltransferase family protein [Planctomycetota bacterium]|nr:CDP-alcohol phosphatidyltransferase family protein [Planctomycetota bacterium]